MNTSGPMGDRRQTVWFRILFWFCGLLLPLLIQQFRYRSSSLSESLPFDTQFTYLPLAKRFIEDAASLFADPDHLIVAPGSFIYLALFGADNQLAIQGNLFFSGLFLLLAFDALRRIAGVAAALVVAWLIAFSPLLPQVLIPAMSEPPQLFFLSVWLWSCALICERPQRRWPAVLGGIALLLSILTRATFTYWIIAAIGACFLLIWRGGAKLRSIAITLLMMHLLAGVGTAAYIAHNKAKFNLPMVATGSGAAIYFGVNPAVAGYEPPYFGLLHDHFQLVDGVGGHLSIEGDKRLNQVARTALAGMPAAALLDLLITKVGATLFFSQAEIAGELFGARAWHILLIVLAAFGVRRFWREPFVLLLICISAYQLAIMALAMHSTRYAIGAVELPLTLLAGFGATAVWHSHFQTRSFVLFFAVLVLGIGGGYWHQQYSSPLMPDLTHVPQRTIATADPSHLKWHGMDGNPFSGEGARITEKNAYVAWETLVFPMLGGIPIVQFRALDFDKSCTEVKLNHLRPNGEMKSISLPLKHLTPPHLISIGTLALDGLEPLGGTLRVHMSCAVGTRIQLKDLKLHTINRKQYFQSPL